MATQHFAVQLKRSASGRKPVHRATLDALGLNRFGKTVYIKDTPANRGMLYSVVHLVTVEPREGEPPAGSRAKARAASAS